VKLLKIQTPCHGSLKIQKENAKKQQKCYQKNVPPQKKNPKLSNENHTTDLFPAIEATSDPRMRKGYLQRETCA